MLNHSCPAETSGDSASSVRSTFQTIHGCRPNSAVHQPDSVASWVSPMETTSTHSSQRAFQILRFHHHIRLATTPMRMNTIPRLIIRWYTWNTRLTSGQSSRGNCSSPSTWVDVLLPTSRLSRHGTWMPLVVSVLGLVQPMIVIGTQSPVG